MIDSQLNWSYYINHIKSKIAKGIGIICKVKNVINVDTLVHCTIRLSILIFSTVYKHGGYIWVFFKYYYKAAKKGNWVISSARRLAHTETLFKDLKILNLSEVYVYNITLFI